MCILPYTLSFEMLFVLRVSFLQRPWLPELCISLHWLNTAWAQLAGTHSLNQRRQRRSSVTQACGGESAAPNKKPQMSENTQTLARKPTYRALVVSYVGLAVRRLRPDCNWKTSFLVLGFGPCTDDAGNRETGSTEGPWQHVQWPVKHFYCQWCSDNHMSCRSNQGRLFPSGGWKLCFVLVFLGGGGGGQRGLGSKGEQCNMIPWYGVQVKPIRVFVTLAVLYERFCLFHFDSCYSNTTSEVEWKEKVVKGDLCAVVTEAREDVGGSKIFSTTKLHMWRARQLIR